MILEHWNVAATACFDPQMTTSQWWVNVAVISLTLNQPPHPQISQQKLIPVTSDFLSPTTFLAGRSKVVGDRIYCITYFIQKIYTVNIIHWLRAVLILDQHRRQRPRIKPTYGQCTSQTQYIDYILNQCWASITESGPTLRQHRVKEKSVYCLSPWIWKGVSDTLWSGRYTLLYPIYYSSKL